MPKRSPLKFRQAASSVVALAALAAASLFAPAPASAAQQREAPASVSGRITDGERAVAGVTVALLSTDPARRFRAVARAKTDAEGRYALSNVAPGRYQIVPYAPALVMQGMAETYPPGRPLTLLAGDEVKDIDFKVERGGVVTGRVTDAEGNPVVAEAVWVVPVDANAPQLRNTSFDQRDQMTDDRGVYRIYGLPPGTYRVCVGLGGDEVGAVSFGRRRIFRRTYHPDTTEQAQARAVEVKAGDVAENVDITVGRPMKTYRASGRFVAADTGQPVPGLTYGYGTLDASGRRISTYGSGQTTNARGEFTTEALAPGRYAVFSLPGMEASEFYTEQAPFEIVDSDVAGVVVRVRRGASISGVVQIEGVGDRAALARMLTQVRVFGWLESRNQLEPPFSQRPSAVNPDGTFVLPGLRPGKFRLGHSSEGAKGLTLARVELNGVNVGGGIDVAEGAQVAGVRVVLTYGTSVITGQTSYVGGAPPPGARVLAQARRLGAAPPQAGQMPGHNAGVDARGFFRIEGLPAGEYEVVVRVFGQGPMFRSEPLNVSLPEGGEVRITPVINFTPPGKGGTP